MSVIKSVTISDPISAFGEISTAESRAYIQATAAYDQVPTTFREFTSGTGTTGAEGGLFKVTTGTGGLGSYGTIQSFRSLNYKAGEGGLGRFTGLFESSSANSWQAVGMFTIGDELSFVFNGTAFGIWHRYGGLSEIRSLEVTGSAGGSENATITLNGTAYVVPLTSGTVQHNAFEIQEWFAANQSVWNAEQVDDTVTFTALSDGAKSGSYSLASSSATGTFSQVKAGVTKTSTHVPQADWNGDTVTIDPTKGNVFQIQYQYLGFGNIYFSVEDPETGRFKLVHTLRYANENTSPSLANPSLHLGLYAVSIGSTDNLVVKSASMAGFVQGLESRTRNPRAEKNTQTISTTFTNVLTIRNSRAYNGKINQQELEPVLLSLASESGKNVEVEIIADPTVTGDRNYQDIATSELAHIDTSAVTYSSGGDLLFATTVAGNDSASEQLTDLRIRIAPTSSFSVFARVTSGANASFTSTLTWYEDI